VFDLVSWGLEIKVVEELVGFALDVLKVDFEFELAPTVFCYSKGRRFED
jgi:hypothetical protein